MNLLLLLSALLTALTGVGGVTRAPQVAQAVTGANQAAMATTARAPLIASRPVQTLPVLRAVARGAGAALLLPSGAPLWVSRRRE